MAFVGISERLRDDVRNTIRRKQSQELALLPKVQTPLQVQPDDPRLVEKFWGEHAHLRDVMPEAWCLKVENVQFIAPYEQDPGNPASVANINVTVYINGGMKVPPKTDTYHPRVQVRPDAPEVTETISIAQQQYTVNKRWNKVAEDVMTFLTNCKSLNEALKLWPDVRIYVPQQYLDKAEEKTQKAKAAESKAMEILKSIDTDHAVSSAVMVRILEANKQQESTS